MSPNDDRMVTLPSTPAASAAPEPAQSVTTSAPRGAWNSPGTPNPFFRDNQLSRSFATSPTSSAAPGDSPFYNRVFWASYKGLSRGLLGGLLLGGLLGAAIGGLVLGGLSLTIGLAAVETSVISLIVAATTLVGMKYYKDVFSMVGANTGAISAAMEINEERSEVINQKLDKLLELEVRRSGLDPKELHELQKEADLVRHRGLQHFEDKFDVTQPIFWWLAATGAVVGAIFGGIMLWAGHNFLTDIVSHAGVAATPLTDAMLGGSVLAATTLGGASFGINRHYFRQHFNVTNALYEGDLRYVGKQRAQEIQKIAEVCESQDSPYCNSAVQSVQSASAPAASRYAAQSTASARPNLRVTNAEAEGRMQQAPAMSTQASNREK